MSEEDQDEILLRGRLDGRQRIKLIKLLDMMYSPAELAEEIGFSVRQVYRVYVPSGCPYEKDHLRRVWINGKAFREWALEVYKKRELAQNEAFCLTCKKAVTMISPERKQAGRLVYYLCVCPSCGRKIARIIERGKLAA